MDSANQSRLRTLLVLGRVSNVPTVWSNCLAAWWLGGGGSVGALLWVCFAATLLYIGGMFLNDVFDVEFDRVHRKERPIPSGAISLREVRVWSIAQLAAGFALMLPFGSETTFYAVLLLGSIVLYDATHKQLSWSPLIMAACRFFLFLAASSVGANGVNGLTIWCAAALASYITGLSYVAKHESAPGMLRFWPCIFVAFPLVLAGVVNDGEFRTRGFIFMAVLAVWVARCLRLTYSLAKPEIGRTVSGLLAGIVLVDLLAVADSNIALAPWFCLLFVLALVFQRFVPAT
ncbi:MAG: UbiA family prenyltransferase [Verrucomicrobiota bacterium]